MEKKAVKIGTEVEKTVVSMKNGKENAPVSDKGKNKENTLSETDAKALQDEINRKTEELQKCLQMLEYKKQLSNNRKSFLMALDDLNGAIDSLEEEETFDSKLYKLRFTDASSYNSNDIFTIGNRFIVIEFAKFIQGKIQEKISEIEAELISE